MMLTQVRRKQVLSTTAFGSLVAVLVGCGGADHPLGPRSTLTYDDFVVATAETDVTDDQHADADSVGSAGETDSDVSNNTSSASSDDEAVQSGDQSTTGPAQDDPLVQVPRLRPGDAVVVDSLVGQINGRPVYANSFFAPIDDRLRVARERQSPLQFQQTLEGVITSHLIRQMQSEVFLAEAQSRLTPEQQQGLIAWLTQQRETIISERGGSEGLATVQLRDEGIEGGIHEAVENERDRALIQLLLQQEVRPRVIVAWRDIEREYERLYDTYNPPGTARIAWIRLTPGRDDARIEQVQQQLLAGADFLEVATDVGMRNEGILYEAQPLGPRGFADAEINELYREQLDGLSEGETSEPFIQPLTSGGEWLVWLHLVSIERPPGRSIYDADVQLEIRDRIATQKYLDEQQKYFVELLDEDIMSELEDLRDRLVVIARARYGLTPTTN